MLWWVTALAALIGGLWLVVIHALGDYLLLISIDVSCWGAVPWPTVLLLGGLLIGLVLAGLGIFLAGLQARRHRRRIVERLCWATDEVVNVELIEPLRAETHGWAELARILERITRCDTIVFRPDINLTPNSLDRGDHQCHHGAVHVDAYTETLRRTLAGTSSLGDDRTQDVARSLAAAFDPVLYLIALQMLMDTTDELNGELGGIYVAVVMDGATPHLLVTQADRSGEREQDRVTGSNHHAETPVHAVPEVEEGPEVCTTLRLPESLKQQIDTATRMQGCSVNAWLVEAARDALSEQSPASGSQRPPSTGNDGAGSDRSASGSDGGHSIDWCAGPAQHRSLGTMLTGWFS